MSLTDDLLKLAGIAGSAWTLYSLFRKAPLESRALEAGARKVAAETEALELDNEDVRRKQWAEMDERVALMRSQLNQQADKGQAQQEEISQLSRAAVRHSNDIEQANKDAADYKSKWDECMASCQAQAAEIRKLRAILTKNGWLTPEIEAAIQAELDLPAATPPGDA